jgi:anti-sigma regulatory factor (Ser/Thr protein kinase)
MQGWGVEGRPDVSSKVIQKTVTMPCDPKCLSEVRDLLKEMLGEVQLSERDKNLIILGVDEALGSVIRYGRDHGYNNEITLTLDIDDVRFKATLRDSWMNGDLNGLSGPALDERLSQDRKYTLSLYLMRLIMDEISYIWKKGFQNDLEIIKFL